jgi:thioredoxin reductase
LNKFVEKTKVIIIGAGPAGLGCAALLKQMKISPEDMQVFEAKTIGSAFKSWPEQMRLITPSFPSNGYHQTDLNAITPDTSPAFNSGKEHLSGQEYAQYLVNTVEHYELKVIENCAITKIEPLADQTFKLTKQDGKTIFTQYVIWAGGEFHSPNLNSFSGSEYCIHNSHVKNWDLFTESSYTIIGCYESGVDAAYHLASRGKQITLLDGATTENTSYDPSKVLSPYTAERIQQMANADNVNLVDNFKVASLTSTKEGYQIRSTSGELFLSNTKPFNCTGFTINLGPAKSLFNYAENGYPIVNRFDESTRYKNLFLSGSQLSYGDILLCFIYKFRGRFSVPCSTIGAELELDLSILKHYQQAGMLLNDLSCCESQECFC